VGTLGGQGRVAVDRLGMVHPMGASWSLDWWVGAEDRWRVPSSDTTVRQRLVDDAPVVETLMRVPGGDAVSRVYALAGSGGGDTFVFEVEAACAMPFALAWVLRPVSVHGPGRLGRIDVDGAVVRVEGREVLWLPGRPGRMVLSSGMEADAGAMVAAGEAGDAATGSVVCSEGRASAAFVVAVAHRSVVTARLVIGHVEAPATSRLFRRRRESPPAPAPVSGPGAAAVGRAWRAQSERSLRLDLPPGRLASAVAAQRRYLPLLAATVGEPDPSAARVVVATAQAGFDAEAIAVARRWFVEGGAVDDLQAACGLWTLGWLRCLGLDEVPPGWLPGVARRAEQLGRAGRNPDPVGVEWRQAGLRAAADVLAAAGEAVAARRVTGWASEVFGAFPSGSPGAAPDGELALGVALAGAELAGGRRGAGGSLLDRALDGAGPTWVWPDDAQGVERGDEQATGHGPRAAAEIWTLARRILADDRSGRFGPGSVTLGLCSWWPQAWGHSPLEVHGLRTRAGVLSYAVRWHGPRPAVLWEICDALAPVVVRAGFDPSWSSDHLRGEVIFEAGLPVAHGPDDMGFW